MIRIQRLLSCSLAALTTNALCTGWFAFTHSLQIHVRTHVHRDNQHEMVVRLYSSGASDIASPSPTPHKVYISVVFFSTFISLLCHIEFQLCAQIISSSAPSSSSWPQNNKAQILLNFFSRCFWLLLLILSFSLNLHSIFLSL